MAQVGRQAAALQALPPPAELPASSDEDQLAREANSAAAADRARSAGGAAAEAQLPPAPCIVQAIQDAPPQNTTFADLEQLARIDPALMQARWDQIKQVARDDFHSGWLAGRVLEVCSGDAWQRACFLVLREALWRAWRPRDGSEALLVDQLAQYQALLAKWITILALRTDHPYSQRLEEPLPRGEAPRRVTHAQATAEAMRMVDQLARLCERTLQVLRGRKSGRDAPLVGHVDQLNVAAGTQISLMRKGRAGRPGGRRPATSSSSPPQPADAAPARRRGSRGARHEGG